MIRLDNVTKTYGTDIPAVRDASFEVAKGEFVFMVGPSGSGKSTLLRLMNRQEQPERGAVWARMSKGGDLHPRHTHEIAYTIPFSDLQAHCEKLIASGVRGRAVVRFSSKA